MSNRRVLNATFFRLQSSWEVVLLACFSLFLFNFIDWLTDEMLFVWYSCRCAICKTKRTFRQREKKKELKKGANNWFDYNVFLYYKNVHSLTISYVVARKMVLLYQSFVCEKNDEKFCARKYTASVKSNLNLCNWMEQLHGPIISEMYIFFDYTTINVVERKKTQNHES